MTNTVSEIERIASDIAEAEFLAGVEVTTGAAQMVEWLESVSSIQRRCLDQYVEDWRQTGTAFGHGNLWAVWLDHAGRRISHLSASVLEVLELNDRKLKYSIRSHKALGARRD